MRQTNLAILAGTILGMPFAASADMSDYTYLDGTYVLTGDAEISANAPGFGSAQAEEDYDGWNLKASMALTPNVFIQADYSELEADNDNGELESISAGVGMRAPVGSKAQPADVFGVLSYESLEETSGSEIEADGFGITGGIRWKPVTDVEVSPYVSYLDYGDIDDSNVDLDGVRFGVDGVFSVNEQFALTAGYRTTKLELSGNGGTADFDLENEIRIGARFYFAGL